MPGGLVFIFFAIRREAAARRAEASRAGGCAAIAVKKVRIWDEEDA